MFLIAACGPLGMEDRRIQDSQINSSSDWDGFHRAALARLHNEMSGGDKGAWSAKEKQIGEYLQIDLGQVTWITHAATQGRHEIDREINQWVMSYKLTYSDDGAEWKEYKEAGQTKVFSANRDRDSVVTNPLFPAIKSRYIRFLPLTWYKHISMRVEIYGCGL
ncbi:predicted protein [Nematostella vectensis]|uniref:F5/8 type C domain-containing protein n=1 Tax=Nematostella vectensis TaxID=45351 RepID=A7SF80_NEMVE|nr:predicted protein [Nematostella vectensis]|eukprot:XP_001629723.1 predicted protein [Nematostella vectensis]